LLKTDTWSHFVEAEEGLDLLNEDNKVVKEARKILETGSRRQVKTPQKYNPLEQIRQEVTLYRKKTHDKLVEKKKEEKQKATETEGSQSNGATDVVLSEEELASIQKEVEEKVKKFLKEQDAEKDMEWFKSQFVVQVRCAWIVIGTRPCVSSRPNQRSHRCPSWSKGLD
jgi:phosphoketolase